MDSQCKCHSGGTNIFRFYDKHKCIINLDLARNTELVPNMSHSQMLGKFEYGGGPIFKVVIEC